MQFNQSVKIISSAATSSLLYVDIPAQDLKEALKVGYSTSRHWRKAPGEGQYVVSVGLQIQADTASDARAILAEVVIEQACEVTGYVGDALLEVVQRKLPQLAMPYVRAQLAGLLLHSGYHFITLPVSLPGENLPSIQRDSSLIL
jgi:hypothetical protein